MALLPPANAAGINLPVVPQNPPIFGDVGRAVDYVAELNHSMHAHLSPVPATAQEVGNAEAYKIALVNALAPPPAAPLPAAPPPAIPPWAQALQVQLNAVQATGNAVQATVNALQATVNALQATVNNMNIRFVVTQAEQPILLANSQAGTQGPLYDPTAPANWLRLAAPNPTTRDELLSFTQQQCVASAAALGIPPILVPTPVLVRRRQIAARIGVMI